MEGNVLGTNSHATYRLPTGIAVWYDVRPIFFVTPLERKFEYTRVKRIETEILLGDQNAQTQC